MRRLNQITSCCWTLMRSRRKAGGAWTTGQRSASKLVKLDGFSDLHRCSHFLPVRERRGQSGNISRTGTEPGPAETRDHPSACSYWRWTETSSAVVSEARHGVCPHPLRCAPPLLSLPCVIKHLASTVSQRQTRGSTGPQQYAFQRTPIP